MFWIFKKYYSGALPDERPNELKEKDIYFNEIVSSPQEVEWTEKQSFRKFPEMIQGKTNQCVAFSIAKSLSIYYYNKYNDFIKFSPAFIYVHRMNKPTLGMWVYDGWSIVKNKGAVLEELFKTPTSSDKDVDALTVRNYLYDVSSVFKITQEIYLPINIDVIASVIEVTKKSVVLVFFYVPEEFSRKVPVLKDLTVDDYNRLVYHAVVAVDYTLYNGQKSLIIEDSGLWGGEYQKIITESFLNRRCTSASYFMNFKFTDIDISDFKGYKFYRNLKIGDKGDDVKVLQLFLKNQKTFPSNVEATGYFGNITKNSLIKFQNINNLQPTGYLDNDTILFINKLLK